MRGCWWESGDFLRALDEYRILGRTEEHAGRTLFDFAMQAADLGAFDAAATAFGEVLVAHPDAPVAADAQLGLADLYRQQGAKLADNQEMSAALPCYESATEAYRAFLQSFPEHAESAEALRRIGDLQYRVFREHDTAERTLLEVVRRYSGSGAAHQARFDLGQLAIERNDLTAATTMFALLESDLGSHDPLARRAHLERALIHFYQGQWEKAGSMLASVSEHTTTDVANDAISLHALLLQNPGPDSANAALQQYATAKLLLRQHQAEAAIEAARRLLEYWGHHPVADDTRFLHAEALLAAQRTEEALLAFGELPLAHPQSPLADRSLFQYATILDRKMGNTSEALKAYADFLKRFPGSLLVPEARNRIRTLRGEET